MTSSVTIRNKAIKQTLKAAFPGRKITVNQAREMRGLCYQLLEKASIDLGSRYTDDTCQFTAPEVSIRFNDARYYRTMRHQDGTMSVIRNSWTNEWEAA